MKALLVLQCLPPSFPSRLHPASFPSSLPAEGLCPSSPSVLSPCPARGARVLSGEPLPLPCRDSLEENLHCKFQLKTNIHG